ncbi:hypothetical protein [Pacificibacter maritimus]|uniref:hypothetical protein n=1 Tax=Pacificibacter maritimus TaxID=762213 RepID=UPI000F509974|nr:hypothetical protein [Pacificibacter maritimus]
MKYLRHIIAAIAVVLLGAVGVLWRSEFSVVFSMPDGAEVFVEAEQGLLQLPKAGSNFAAYKQMLQCDEWMTSVFGAFSSAYAHENIAQACGARAEEILASSPSFSSAHLVKAGAARKLGDIPAAVNALAISQSTAPSEGALATRRLRTAFLIGSDALGDAAAQDVLIAVDQGRYRQFVAQYYWAYPDHRDWLSNVLEGLDAQQMRRVFGAIKQAAPGAGQ